jgi:hypothetical protein
MSNFSNLIFISIILKLIAMFYNYAKHYIDGKIIEQKNIKCQIVQLTYKYQQSMNMHRPK